MGVEDVLRMNFNPLPWPDSLLFIIFVSIKKSRFLASENSGMGVGQGQVFLKVSMGIFSNGIEERVVSPNSPWQGLGITARPWRFYGVSMEGRFLDTVRIYVPHKRESHLSSRSWFRDRVS